MTRGNTVHDENLNENAEAETFFFFKNVNVTVN